MKTRSARLVSGGLAVLTCLALPSSYAVGAGAQAATGPHGSLVVEGYVEAWGGGAAAYLRNRGVVDTAGVDGVEVRADADSVTGVPGGALSALHAAHRHHDRAELLVSNYSDSLGDFDPALAQTLLGSAVHRRHVAAALAELVRRQGWDGIQVDLESLGRSDGPGLASFVGQLRADLPARAGLSMAVMAETSGSAYVRHGYVFDRLRGVDRFVLMAYDQHGPGWSGPGPVGSLPWARRTALPLVAAVGAERVDLGIAGYGYLWRPDGSGRTVSDARARAMAKGSARWNARDAEWSAHTADGTLWWSDHRSFLRRVALAHGLGLHGVAVWQLASSDPLAG
jgi:spore germination protein